jgi:hypothetical protein
MQFRKALLGSLGRMICGEAPYNDIFPYRSSSYLSRFFHNVDLDFTHDGTSRYPWVLSVLDKINVESPNPDLPSENMVKVIESLVHPDYYLEGVGSHDRKRAIQKLNEALKPYELFVEIDKSTEIPYLSSLSGSFISTAVNRKDIKKSIHFSPSVFQLPQIDQNPSLVAVMMPFSAEFDNVYSSIRQACKDSQLSCLRADNLWANSTIIQDIFDLIYSARIIIVDFSGRNPNVMYETGIAHTLGKVVIPITQSLDDIPFDLKPHRALRYLSNREGLEDLNKGLKNRLKTVINGNIWSELSNPSTVSNF